MSEHGGEKHGLWLSDDGRTYPLDDAKRRALRELRQQLNDAREQSEARDIQDFKWRLQLGFDLGL